MLFKSLESDDVFVSYSRKDAATYAVNLVDELVKKGFSCFTDRLGTEAGTDLPATLLEKLRRCRMLVVLCTEGTKVSPFVGREVKAFADAKGSTSMIVPVVFDQTVMKSDWYKVIEGMAPQYEDIATLQTGQVSKEVLKRIEDAFKYSKKQQRIRKWIRIGTATVGALAVLIAVAAVMAFAKTREATRAISEAVAARTAATAANDAAREAEANAKQQQDIAKTQAGIAAEQTRKAEEATRKANDAKGEAEEQQRIADQQAQRAATQTRIAASRELLAEAQLSRFEGEDTFQKPVSLAIQSYDTYPSYEPDALLRYGLEKLPPRRSFVSGVNAPEVYAIAYDQQSTKLYTASADHRVHKWDVTTQKEIPGFEYAESVVSPQRQFVKFSTNGASLMAVLKNEPQTAVVWSVATGRVESRIKHAANINDIALSDDGAYAATASDDSTVQVWKVGSKEPATTMRHEGERVIRVLFSPEGDVVASVSANPHAIKDHLVKIWRRDSGEEVLPPTFRPACVEQAPRFDCSIGLAFSDDGRFLAYAKYDTVTVFDLNEPKRLGTLETDLVAAVAIHSGEKMNWLATAHNLFGEGSIHIYDLDEDLAPLSDLDMQHELPVKYIAFVLGEQASFRPSIISVTQDDKAHWWNTQRIFGRMVETVRLHHGGKIRAVTSSRGPGKELFITTAGINGVNQWHSFGSGDYILVHDEPPSAAFSQNVRFVAVNSGARVHAVDVITGDYLGGLRFSVLHGPVISNNGRYLFARIGSDSVSVWDIQDDREIRHIDASYFLNDDSMSIDMRLIALQRRNKRLFLWNPFENTSIDLPETLTSLAFSPDNKHFAARTNDPKSVEIWTFSESKPGALKLSRVTTIKDREPVTQLKYSPKGAYLLTLGRDGTGSLWRRSGQRIRYLSDASLEASFSADESRFALRSGSTINVFESATGKRIRSFEFAGEEAVFTSDGRYLATLSKAGIRVWEVATGLVSTRIDSSAFPYSDDLSNGSIRFTPDDHLIVAVTRIGTKRFLWRTTDLVREVRARLTTP